MSKCKSMYAGSSGAINNVNANSPGNGNGKWQGLVSTTNMRSGIIRYVRKRAGDNRNVVFCMNQLGCVGRKSNIFAVKSLTLNKSLELAFLEKNLTMDSDKLISLSSYEEIVQFVYEKYKYAVSILENYPELINGYPFIFFPLFIINDNNDIYDINDNKVAELFSSHYEDEIFSVSGTEIVNKIKYGKSDIQKVASLIVYNPKHHFSHTPDYLKINSYGMLTRNGTDDPVGENELVVSFIADNQPHNFVVII